MNLRKRYEACNRDHELLTHEPELRLIDTHLHHLLSELSKHQQSNAEAFQTVKDAWGKFQEARARGDVAKSRDYLDSIGEIVNQTEKKPEEWGEIREVVEIRRRILESETRRIKEQSTTMSAEQVLAIVEFLVGIIRTAVLKYASHETGKQILGQITNDIGSITARPDQASPGIAKLLA